MESFLIDFAFSTVLTLLRSVIKNPKSKAQYEPVLRKVYTKIGEAYPEFKEEE